jgi:hypothetical protein
MKEPKIDWPSDKETDEILEATGATRSQIETLIKDALRQAEIMAGRGVNTIAPILDGPRDTWESAWNRNATLTRWFGKVSKPNHVKDVHRRMDAVCDRLSNRVQTIKVRSELPHDYTAQNLGGPLSPNTFKVAIDWIKRGLNDRAAIMIHESQHAWFKDQKIDGETVYGSALAEELAKENPDKARRSPENYEHYCRDLQAIYEQSQTAIAR